MELENGTLEFAMDTARRAGLELLHYFGAKVSYAYKYEKTIVTKADYESERLILDAIRAKYPSHGVLAEESGRSQSQDQDRLWIVDPLDGTTNFAAGIPFFGVSIALQANDAIQLGVTYDPIRDEMFYVRRGQGAFLNGSPIRVRSITQMEEAIAGIDVVLFEGKRQQIVKCIQSFSNRVRSVKILGAAILSFAYVASGRFDVYLANVLRPWDLATGLLLVEESGGRYTTFDNRPVDIMSFQNVFCSNGLLHQEGLDLLSHEVLNRSPNRGCQS